jgi:signal transduction histidine kinase
MSSLATSHVDAKPEVKNDVTEDIRIAITQALGTVAHELRQPLSNIEAIAYYLSMILPRGDAKIQLQLARIRELVEQSDLILSNALGLETAPAAGQQPVTPRA